jgi:hypothetical protein
MRETRNDLHAKWDDATAREKRSRTVYAQESIKVDEVAKELAEARGAIGSGVDVRGFFLEALTMQGAAITLKRKSIQFDISGVPRALRDSLGMMDGTKFEASFDLPVEAGVIYLNRTHPVVESLANYAVNTSLDPIAQTPATRCGVVRSRRVKRRTTVLLVRFRYHIIAIRQDHETPLLAEECRLMGFGGSPESAEWLDESDLEKLLLVEPDANITPDLASNALSRIQEGFEALWPRIEAEARERADILLDAHRRVRTAARLRGVNYRVVPHLPPDIIGTYIYLPLAGAQNQR